MSAEDRPSKGRKPRNYYVDYTKNNNKFRDNRRGPSSSNNARYKEAPDLSFGHRGFLVTSIDEVKSYLEMRGVLESYFELIYKSTQANDDAKVETTTEDEVEAELKQLRATKPFKQVKTYCRNSIFINITKEFPDIDPNLIVEKFFEDLQEKREIRTRNTFKVLPILDTFRSSVSCAKECVANILETRYKDTNSSKNYFIEMQSRGNYKLNPEDKQKLVEGIADTISELRPDWKVSRDGADFMVTLVVLRNVCCISFLRNYFQFAKYNVIEFCKEFAPTELESNEVVEVGHEPGEAQLDQT